MPEATHLTAAEQHEAAAEAHRTAADLLEKGDQPAAAEKSTEANRLSKAAQTQSAQAAAQGASPTD